MNFDVIKKVNRWFNIKKYMIDTSIKITGIYMLMLFLIISVFFKSELFSIGHMTWLRLIRSLAFTFISFTLLQSIYVTPQRKIQIKNLFECKKCVSSLFVALFWIALYTMVFSQDDKILAGDIGNYYLIPSLIFCSSVLCLYIISYTRYKILGCIIYSTIAFFFLLTAIFFVTYFYLYGQQFDEYALLCVIATNFDEILNYLTATFSSLQILLFGIFIVLLFSIVLFISLTAVKESGMKTYKKKSVIYGIFLTGYLFYYLSSVFPIDQWLHLYRLGGPMNAFIQLQQNIKSNADKIIVKSKIQMSDKNNETIVLIIGESACRDRMSAFNSQYPVNTTPWEKDMLENENFIFFEKAYSNFPNTVMAVTQALTNSNQYNGVSLKNAVDIINIAKCLGYKTYWLSTQNKSTVSDAGITILANQADEAIWVKGYDEILLDKIQSLPKNESKFLVIQLTGSHFNYNRRVPKAFLQENNMNIFNDNNKTKWYEYSLRYTDSILKEIFMYCKNEHNLQVMVYFSDHGEDIKYTHTASPFLFNMVRIPLWIYLSPNYQKLNPDIINGLQAHREAVFTNDLIFETVSGILKAKSNVYEDIYDLSSFNYSITKNNSLTMHGKKYLKDDL